MHAFITAVAAGEGQALLAKERPNHHHKHEHKHEHNHEHKHEAKEETKVEEKPVAAQANATSWPGEEVSPTVADGSSPAEEKIEKFDSNAAEEHHNNKDGHRGGRGGRGGFRGNKNFYYRKHNTDEEGFTVVKDEEAHHNHYPSRRHQNAARGNFRGGRGQGGRGGFQKDGEGQRGGRGGRPWTAKEHRNEGEVRKTEFEQPGDDNGPKSESQ